VPGELLMGIIYKDWPALIPVGGFTSYAGDVLAVVVADSRLNARNAVEHVEVEYKVLKPITDQREAINRQIESVSSPEALAAQAQALGMRPSQSPVFLNLDEQAQAIANGEITRG
jgi:CO/xanthine dehydrogenase Mo-binding subunit